MGAIWLEGVVASVVNRGTSGSRDCHRASNCTFNTSVFEAFTISAGTLNAECMLAASGFTPLLVNLESMAAKPRTGGRTAIIASMEN